MGFKRVLQTEVKTTHPLQKTKTQRMRNSEIQRRIPKDRTIGVVNLFWCYHPNLLRVKVGLTSMKTKNEEPRTFAAGASMRIQGSGLDMETIAREFGHNPSHSHRQGEPDQLGEPYKTDMWLLRSVLDTTQPLEAHLRWLAEVLLPCRQYISLLREKYDVDIYCYKTCYTEQASLTLSSQALRIFTELDFKLGVSLIFLPHGSVRTALEYERGPVT